MVLFSKEKRGVNFVMVIHFFALRSTPKFDFYFLILSFFHVSGASGYFQSCHMAVDMTKALQTKCNAWFGVSQEDSTCALKIEFQNLFFWNATFYDSLPWTPLLVWAAEVRQVPWERNCVPGRVCEFLRATEAQGKLFLGLWRGGLWGAEGSNQKAWHR